MPHFLRVLPLMLLLADPARGALITVAEGFTPTLLCMARFHHIIHGSVELELNGQPARILGLKDLTTLFLKIGKTTYRNPAELFGSLVKDRKEAAGDPVLVEAWKAMKAPADPNRFAVLCLPGSCKLSVDGTEADGAHYPGTSNLKVAKVTQTDLKKSLADMKAKVGGTKPLEIQQQTIAIRLPRRENLDADLETAVLEWYAVIAHEASHAATDRLVADWVNANRRLLLTGGKPDDMFLYYCRINGADFVLDETFLTTLHEGLSYSVMEKSADLLAEYTDHPGIDPAWKRENYRRVPFQTYTATRPAIRTELGLTSENWFTKMRQTREFMLQAVKIAPPEKPL